MLLPVVLFDFTAQISVLLCVVLFLCGEEIFVSDKLPLSRNATRIYRDSKEIRGLTETEFGKALIPGL